jgi:hypothetical protein
MISTLALRYASQRSKGKRRAPKPASHGTNLLSFDRPHFLGVYDDRRLMVAISFNSDVGDS